jgi:asparagine synthase (glutamine-hydrolysing)
VQSGQGADEVLAGYDWYPPFADLDPELALSMYQRRFVDRTHQQMDQLLAPQWMAPDDHASAFVAGHFARPGAQTALDRALRIDTEVMLVDDPVKRVDNMTMRWGLEARVPFLDSEFVEQAAACPPELKLRHDGKGVLKDAARSLLPADVIDRPKGYFPVPAVIVLEGAHLERVRDALSATAAKDRGLYRPEAVAVLLAAPNDTRTPLGSNALWQVALLEMWLQDHGVG